MHNRFRHQYWSVLLFLCICRRCSWYKHTLSPHLLQLTIRLLASSFSSIFLRAVCNTAHEGSPFLETLSCCFSHAAIIFLLLFSMSPRCSSSILSKVGYRRPRARPRDCHLLRFFRAISISNRSSVPAVYRSGHNLCTCMYCDSLSVLAVSLMTLGRSLYLAQPLPVHTRETYYSCNLGYSTATLLTRGLFPANRLSWSRYSVSSPNSCGFTFIWQQCLLTSWRRGLGTGWLAMLGSNSWET